MNFTKKGDFYLIEEIEGLFLIASSYESSLKHDTFIIEKLKEMNFKGELYVDMLLVKGIDSSRFFKFYFNGQRFETNKTKVIDYDKDSISSKFKDIEKTFCKTYKNIIETSSLSYTEKLTVCGKI